MEKEIWREYQPTVVLVGVARGENDALFRTFNDQAHVTYSIVPDPERAITRLFGSNSGIPRTYVVIG